MGNDPVRRLLLGIAEEYTEVAQRYSVAGEQSTSVDMSDGSHSGGAKAMTFEELPELKKIQTMVSDGWYMLPVDTIEYQSQLWLVPEWIPSNPPGYIRPARMIPLEGLQVQDLRPLPSRPTDLSLISPMPRALLEGSASPKEREKFGVIEDPPIRFQIPLLMH